MQAIKKLTGLLIGSLIWLFAANAVMAQRAKCAPHESAVSYLASTYGEFRQSIGIDDDGRLMEIFANLETGTWTAVITGPDGVSCIAASGQAFESVAKQTPARGVPT